MGDQRRRGSDGEDSKSDRTSGGNAEPDLLTDVRRGLKSGEPTDLLLYASALMATLDPRRRNRPGFEHASGSVLSFEEFAATLTGVDMAETSALLAAIAAMSPDELVRARARRALARRDHHMPRWLLGLGETVVYRAAEMTHVLGDGDNVVLGVRLGTGHELSAVVYVDHNLGTLVKDAFVVPKPIAKLIEFMRAKGEDPDLMWRDISLGDARAKIAHAIACGEMMFPPWETDTWPACRPLLEWLIRPLPVGEGGYGRPDWSERATKELSRRFFASPFGASLNDADHRGLLESVLWFGVECGPGDPMRWSPVNVEILLLDWIPGKVVADAACLSKAPELLRAFVGFCHEERCIRPALTSQTIAAVHQFEPEYQRMIRTPRVLGPAASRAWSVEEYVLGRAAAAVGGEAALQGLDDLPLPDENFDWSGVPDDIRPAVSAIAAECDRFCQDLGDRELRTACRRLLAQAAARGPDAFRRSARTDVAAAAVCWAIGKANDLFGSPGASAHGGSERGGGQPGSGRPGLGRRDDKMLVKDLMRYFGLRQTSVSKRAEVLFAATSWPGDPSLLTSSCRRELIGIRDRCKHPAFRLME